MTKEYTLDDLSRFIDHTDLNPAATVEDMETLCKQAKQYHFKMVAINQVQTSLCSSFLQDTDIHVGAAISFPLGQTTIESKVFETKDAIKNGATEIDYVINLSEVKKGNYEYIENEMLQIVKACKENNVVSKVIFENYYLKNEEIIKLTQIAKKVEPDFIKTSTGMAKGGATFEDVELMIKHAGNKVKVKAAGGIRDVDTFKKMIQLGAKRIGCSAGISIIDEISASMKVNNVTQIEI